MTDRGRRGDALGIGALASFVLSGLAIEKLSQSLDAGGWIGRIGLGVTAVLALSWLVIKTPIWWARLRHRQPPVPVTDTELRSLAEQAEHWLLALGTDADGMAAAEWFELHESELRARLDTDEPGAADDLALIADALETWYIRRRKAADLLYLSERLAVVGDRAGRSDLEELAAVRAAAAYRLIGELDAATTRLGVAASIATRGRTAPAMAARRHVERALLLLARADRHPPGGDREEAVLHARDRLADARLKRPGPDLAADVAILINLGIVQLQLGEPERALDQLRLAAARADAAGDASAHAHALELTGVAAWMQDNSRAAAAWWRRAEQLYADVDDREARARCLQHLGSAALLQGHTTKAIELLDHSALLRDNPDDHPLLTTYRTQAHASQPSTPPPAPPDHPTPLLTRLRTLLSRRHH